MATSLGRRKVLLLEFNEITRTVIDPLIAQGKLPMFQRLLREGAWATPESVDHVPHLDPWVTWVTLHTGVPREVHGATVLCQEDSTILAKRSWDYALAAGRSIGVFGSISAYPPRPVPGFMIPGPFAPSNDTFPKYVEPVQALNRKYTQVHNKNESEDSFLGMAKQAASLFSLGLRPRTCAEAALQLAREKVEPHMHWKRASLQPLINYDFFTKLYRRYRPDFATWHSNHAAHYMHHFWRAWDDTGFLARASEDEKKKFGGAVPYGYELCDRLIARFMKLIDDDTILVIASSMGQQPYVAEMFPEGRIVLRFKDLKRVLDIVGAEGIAEIVPIMTPEWNVKIPDADKRARVRDLLRKAYVKGGSRPAAIDVAETGEILTIAPLGQAEWKGELRYFFPDAPKANPAGYDVDELFAYDAPTPKQGMHHPRGVFALWGKGIQPGTTIADSTNLDVLPTLLSIMGIPIPSILTGRPLVEAWGGRPSSTSSSAARASA